MAIARSTIRDFFRDNRAKGANLVRDMVWATSSSTRAADDFAA